MFYLWNVLWGELLDVLFLAFLLSLLGFLLISFNSEIHLKADCQGVLGFRLMT